MVPVRIPTSPQYRPRLARGVRADPTGQTPSVSARSRRQVSSCRSARCPAVRSRLRASARVRPGASFQRVRSRRRIVRTGVTDRGRRVARGRRAGRAKRGPGGALDRLGPGLALRQSSDSTVTPDPSEGKPRCSQARAATAEAVRFTEAELHSWCRRNSRGPSRWPAASDVSFRRESRRVPPELVRGLGAGQWGLRCLAEQPRRWESEAGG